MPCPKCNGRLDWKERSWTSAGEDPGHWRCINCGKVIYPKSLEKNLKDFEESNYLAAKARAAAELYAVKIYDPSQDPDPPPDEAKEEKMEKKCVECGKPFEPRRSDSKFCSKVCGDRWSVTHKGISRKTLDGASSAPKDRAPVPRTAKPRIPKNGNPDLDAQLAVDLKAMKKRIAQEVMQICQRAIEEAFA